MSDPVAFLRTRLAERLASAEMELSMAARFVPDGHEVTYLWARMMTNRVSASASVLYSPGCPSPADVVANVKAVRAVLDAAEMERHARGEYYMCPAATKARDGFELDREEYPDRDCNCGHDRRVRLLAITFAQPYAEHPKFDPAWLEVGRG